MRYHISDGEPKRCQAGTEPCPKGDSAPHFEGSLEEATKWAEEVNAAEAGGVFSSQNTSVRSADNADTADTTEPSAALYGDGLEQWDLDSIPAYKDGTPFVKRWNEHFSELAEWEKENGREYNPPVDSERLQRPDALLGGEAPVAMRDRGSQFITVPEEGEDNPMDLPDSITEDPSLQGKVIYEVHTRQGGGNRECYCDDPNGDGLHEDHCIALDNEILQDHPLYITDEDDDLDTTYATFYYRTEGTEEQFRQHRKNEEKAGRFNSLSRDLKLVRENKLAPWTALADKSSKPQYSPGSLSAAGEQLQKSKQDKDKLTEYISKVDSGDVVEGDIQGVPTPRNFSESRVLENVRSFQDAKEKFEKIDGAYSEAEQLPEGHLKEYLLGDRGTGSYNTTEKQGRRKVTVRKTYQRGSLLGKELESEKKRLESASNHLRTSPWMDDIRKQETRKKEEIVSGVARYKELDENRKASWAHGWPDDSKPMPPIPMNY